MGKGRKRIAPCAKKFGLPLFYAYWVPPVIGEENSEEEPDEKQRGNEQRFIVLGGGGGDSRTGLQNTLLIAQFDFATNSLSEPTHRFVTGCDIPYRVAVHPHGEGMICSFPKSCSWFEWDLEKNEEGHKLTIEPSDTTLMMLEDVGQQIALTFARDGTKLAAGGEDGHLRVFKWPNVDIILDQPGAHISVKDLDFCSDGKWLASLGDRGPGRVWDLSSSSAITTLAKERDENFGLCRFSRNDDNRLLFTTIKKGDKGWIASWETITWKRVETKLVAQYPISAFTISPDGQLLAVGTIEGDIAIIKASNMQVQQRLKEAHLIFVTSMDFSQDSRALVSVSGDSSARVTVVEARQNKGWYIQSIIIILVILLAIYVYCLKNPPLPSRDG
ncbi:SEC12-like protein 2 [Amborella trichopoda]|uniref:Uncharacterized protein n=1 Tax=Amborella trichopoda TaxID=13333 RepID=W1PDW5_AMBTC|nr:SEC12-like protein 2 [Amborella trichopoda]ERN08132.1 hypothetical protein AMTR_s00018p00087700 [Amborella trichopoda]|eukprot:XP_006846457.1 SEC12-like protein 2 [Amborella trichopoda]